MNRLLLIAALLFAGCADSPNLPTSSVGTASGVKEIRLSDGTRCAVYSDYNKGGIDCEWKECAK